MNEKEAYKLYSEMKESLGAEFLLKEIIKALSSQEFIDNIEYIARMHNFNLEDIE